MEAAARLTSKGQITIPAEVRKVLQLHKGDQLLFEIEPAEGEPGYQVKVSKLPDFFALAGSVPTPPELAGKSYEEIREVEQAAWVQAATERHTGG
jgi:antitoxin PrlF